MEDIEWPLLTVEFNSLRGHQMDGIYEVLICHLVYPLAEVFSSSLTFPYAILQQDEISSSY